MVKRIKKITKNRVTRRRKKLIIIGTEGYNKSEDLYLHEIERKQDEYHFLFAHGNETDPVNIVRNTIKRAKLEEISYKNGDMAFSLFDLDLDFAKENQLNRAKELAIKNNIKLITSNPCFEVWYLQHFGFSSKPFSSSKAVVQELIKKLPKYQKNNCDIDILYPLTEEAINNCKRLIEYHKDNGVDCEFANPRTDVHKLVEILFGKDKLKGLEGGDET